MKNIISSEELFQWEVIDEKYLLNKNSGLYLSCDLEYQIEFILILKFH